MKNVLFLLLFTSFGMFVSAQEAASVTVQAQVTSMISEKETTAKKTSKKKKASSIDTKEETINGKKQTTLINEGEHKAKSRFEILLLRRLEIDAENS